MSNETNPPVEPGDIWCDHDKTMKVAVVGFDSDLNGVYVICDNGMCPHIDLRLLYDMFKRTGEHVDIPGILEKLREV